MNLCNLALKVMYSCDSEDKSETSSSGVLSYTVMQMVSGDGLEEQQSQIAVFLNRPLKCYCKKFITLTLIVYTETNKADVHQNYKHTSAAFKTIMLLWKLMSVYLQV